MLLNQTASGIATVTAFIEVLLDSETTAELCRKIVHSDHGDSQLVGCEILRIEPSSVFSSVGSYGIRVQGLEFSVFSDQLTGEAVRSRSVVVQAFTEELAEPSNSITPKSAIAIPLEHASTPWGVLLLISATDVDDNPIDPETFEAVSQLGAYFLKQNGFSGSAASSGSTADELTTRQLVILEFLSHGQTNAQIAQELMLSESSIRQETVKIYRALGVNNREAAAKQAKGLGLISPPPPRP